MRDRLFLLRVSLGIESEAEWQQGIEKAHQELQHYPEITWELIMRIMIPIFADRRP
jgi:hypothetical protein